jgi:hypothetical protein
VIPGEFVAQDEQYTAAPSNPWAFTLTPTDDDPAPAEAAGCPCLARRLSYGRIVRCDNPPQSGGVCARCAIECRTQEAAA